MSSLKTLILLAIIGLAFANPVEENVEEDADMIDFEDEDEMMRFDLEDDELLEPSSRGSYKLELCSETKHCPDGYKCQLASLDQAVYICAK